MLEVRKFHVDCGEVEDGLGKFESKKWKVAILELERFHINRELPCTFDVRNRVFFLIFLFNKGGIGSRTLKVEV